MNRVALDTNILIYSHDDKESEKQNIARDLIIRSPVVCSQVVSEYISVLKRVLKLTVDVPEKIIVSKLRVTEFKGWFMMCGVGKLLYIKNLIKTPSISLVR